MAKYHKYVFDNVKRKFVGRFEDLYQSETKEHFDSWHQEDSRQLARQICLNIIGQFNFPRILDIGCGKGSFTHLLKKKNNNVVGIDISKTALAIAKSRFPDIDFLTLDVQSSKRIQNFFTNNKFDLIII